jgi:hypothetical protein
MTVPPAHLTDRDIGRFRLRKLQGDALVAFADHLAACADCRRRVAERRDEATALGSLEEALGIAGNNHVSESELQAFVDGRLDGDRRGDISTHLGQCRACAEEVRDLQGFATAFRRPGRVQRAWTFGALAAAAVLVLGIGFTLLSRTERPRPVVVLADLAGEITLDSQGSLAGIGTLAPRDGERVRDALETGRLTVPTTLAALNGRRGALMGSADAPGFRLVSPVGTVVLGTRPTLQWTPLPEAATYVVTLQDQSTGETISSPPVSRAPWTPEQPLVRGRTYAWQVAGSGSGKEIVVPRPPDPPARFSVAGASDAEQLERLPASHLVRGVLYAHAGLLGDAERELAALAAQNPKSEVAGRLLKQIRGFLP